MVERVNDSVEFGIYHKPTSTMRTITSDSHCPIQHKKAAFHSMVHRLCRIPLTVAKYQAEYEYIKETARVNGYKSEMIDKLIVKHARKVKNSNLTTFFSQPNAAENQRVSMNFVPQITNQIKTKFKHYDLEIVYKNNNKLTDMLGSTKDKIDNIEKSGIYSITCNDCKKVYYGQTKRSIATRFKDHCTYIRLNYPNKSAVAAHVLIDGHTNVDSDCVRLVKQVNDERRLDAYEAYYIQNDDNALNLDNGNIDSYLFKCVPKTTI